MERATVLAMLILPILLLGIAVQNAIHYKEPGFLGAPTLLILLHVAAAFGVLRHLGWGIPYAFALNALTLFILVYGTWQGLAEVKALSEEPIGPAVPLPLLGMCLLLTIILGVFLRMLSRNRSLLRHASIVAFGSLLVAGVVLGVSVWAASSVGDSWHTGFIWITHFPAYVLLTAHETPTFGGGKVFYDLLSAFVANAIGLTMTGSVVASLWTNPDHHAP